MKVISIKNMQFAELKEMMRAGKITKDELSYYLYVDAGEVESRRQMLLNRYKSIKEALRKQAESGSPYAYKRDQDDYMI